ncbi:N-acetylglucosamine-6-phosphate deacetylase [Catenulispora sp. NL8]|uniref:N-acetylglucosamine-6-phosphate deacetylase n=1 Tax=Catenulispora pinistramenti TaxID=2705254 RepID=A0ABS5L3S2_9ACTN|nr:N-acetylglucosamine-6-phosphate deacetylase [Catenulispora pinistramenti]
MHDWSSPQSFLVTSISAPRVLLDGRLAGPATVVVDDGVVAEVLDGASPEADITLDRGVLTPGLVDIQTNGCFGVDFITASEQDWHLVSDRLPSTGVTAFQPTYITAPMQTLLSGLDRAGAVIDSLRGAQAMGVHLEGPFLSPQRPGVHDPQYLVDPTPDRIDAVLATLAAEHTRDLVTMVTLAPELEGGLEAVRRLAGAGIRVSLGHTDALAAQVLAAADAGATLITHIFNAQRPLNHREPGVPGAALYDARFTCGLIADLHHVAPEICTLVWRAAAGRVALVTDAIAAAGMPPGEYELSGIKVFLGEDGVPRDAAGVIGGSALTLDRAIRNLVGIGLDEASVLSAATRVPADALGRPDLGRIAPGTRADLAWFDDGYRPLRTWVAGRSVFEAGSGAQAPNGPHRLAREHQPA